MFCKGLQLYNVGGSAASKTPKEKESGEKAAVKFGTEVSGTYVRTANGETEENAF